MMVKINRHNYEAFIIDYMEGNLSSSRKEEFLQFMAANPDLKEEFESWEEVKINPTQNISFPEKNTLKKNNAIFLDESPFEELCIAKLEGDLTKNETILFDQYIKEEQEKAKTYKLYTQTKLTPDNSVTYPEKEKLKIKEKKKYKLYNINYQQIIAFAASVTLLFGLLFSNSNDYTNYNDRYSNYVEDNIKFDKSIIKNNMNLDRTINSNTLKDLSLDYNNLLPPIEVQNINHSILSNNLTKKLQPKGFDELKSQASRNAYTTTMTEEIRQQEILLARRIDNFKKKKTSSSQYKPGINSPGSYINRVQSNQILLDVADLGFKSLSKLTGKEMELKRSYDKKGELKKLAFKTERFSISTKIND